MDRKNYLTTGEFARIMGTTKNTLFHYDKIGLFRPEIVLDNEYRYYSLAQTELFDAIMLLRDLGMSLQEIQQALTDRSPQNIIAMLRAKEEQLSAQIEHIRLRKQWIHTRLQRMEQVLTAPTEQVEVIDLPPCYAVSATLDSAEYDLFCRTISQLMTRFSTKNPNLDYQIGYLHSQKDILEKNFTNYHTVLLLTDKKPQEIPSVLRPGGTYLRTFYKGHWSRLEPAYRRLLDYAKAHDLTLCGDFYETTPLDILTSSNENEYVTEIVISL